MAKSSASKQKTVASPEPPAHRGLTIGFWVTAAIAAAYCLWLGVRWLPQGWSANELSASASRVWDIKRQLIESGRLELWTPNFMSGSSYVLNDVRGLYVFPWLLFSSFADLAAAGKLTALAAIFASALTMYFCARYFLRRDWAAVLAAVAYLLHQQQLSRAINSEHITICLSFPFIPLLWLTFARALETNRLRDILWCALAVVGALFADNKQALANCVLLGGYLVYWLWPAERRQCWRLAAKTCAGISAVVLALGMIILVPALTEQKLVKLFYGDPLHEWQKTYSFKSLLPLLDRNGALADHVTEAIRTDPQVQAAEQQVRARGGRATPEEIALLTSAMRVRMLGGIDKYAGLVWAALLVVTVLFNAQRQNRGLFWLLIALLLASFMFSCGPTNVWSAHVASLTAWFGLEAVPGSAKLAGLLLLATLGTFFWQFWRRKLTTTRKQLVAGAALGMFLFVPAFALISQLPMFKEIRAPYVFYDTPAAFLGALLLGFLVTDVLSTARWQPQVPKLVLGVGALLVLDYWPYQREALRGETLARTLTNLQASYAALAPDHDMVKTYNTSGRYFHLLGPMWSRKPQVYEAFYNWMCPLGTGLINQQAFSSWDNHRAFLNILAARYVVFDKTDPGAGAMQQLLNLYRQTYPAFLENDDFVVFRNDAARPYVSAYARACLYAGDVHQSPQLALGLATRGWPLVQASGSLDDFLNGIAATRYEKIFVYQTPGQWSSISPKWRDKVSLISETLPPTPPPAAGQSVALSDVQVVRETHDRVRIRLRAPQDCLAVISESYYPFWQATVDGKPASLQRVNCALMGLDVTAGDHTVLLTYQPPRSYAVAGMVSAVSLVGCLGLIIPGLWRRN